MEFKRYETELTVNGHAVKVVVRIEVEEDMYAGSDEPEEYEAVKRRGNFLGVVSVNAIAPELDLQGGDALGMCEISCNNMFNSKPFQKSVNEILKEHAMEAAALADLKKQLECEYRRLTAQAERYRAFATKETL